MARVPMRTRGQQRVSSIAPEPPGMPEDRVSTTRPSEIKTEPMQRERVAQPLRGAGIVPAQERQSSDNMRESGPSATTTDTDKDSGAAGADVSQATISRDVTNINKNIEKNDQSLEGQIRALQGRTAVLEQDNAAMTASVDELQGNANYQNTPGGGGVGGLLGFSTTTWIIVIIAIGAGLYFWNRSRSAQVEQVEPVGVAPPPAAAAPGRY